MKIQRNNFPNNVFYLLEKLLQLVYDTKSKNNSVKTSKKLTDILYHAKKNNLMLKKQETVATVSDDDDIEHLFH